MKNNRTFYKCDVCGNIVEVIESSGVKMVCCNQEMRELNINTTDAAQEKHVPVAVRDGDKVHVTVGSVPHPMLKEHHISWIIVAQNKTTQRIMLEVPGEPKATFKVDDGPYTVYEYCNLHGLWAADFE